MDKFNGEYNRFLHELIKAGGWEVRYNPNKHPYAALTSGFGNGEKGIKLHFTFQQGRVKVIGSIDYSDKINVKRPHVYVSLWWDTDRALREIHENLLPKYKRVWEEAQPAIEAWLKSENTKE